MTGLDYIIEAELTGPLAVAWLNGLATAMQESLARWAADQIDFDRGVPLESWLRLDDPAVRTVAIASDPKLGSGLAGILIPEKDAGVHADLEAAAQRFVTGNQSKVKLRGRIAPLVPRWLPRPEIVELAASMPIPQFWVTLANEIGRRIYPKYADWRAAGAAREWQFMNYLLIAEYFRQCRHTNAARVAQDLHEASNSAMSIRGSLVNTARWVSREAVAETAVPISGFYGSVQLQHRDRSTLLACMHRESASTASGNGVMSRIAGPHTADVPEDVRSGRVSTAAWLRARGFAYLRYERTILAFMGIASIEQLVRAYAAHRNVPNYKPNGAPDGVPSLLKHQNMQLPKALGDKIRMIFDSGKGNIRNRVMHGAFMLTSTKRMHDNLMAGGMAAEPAL
jgi:hypothetical protein